MSDLASVFQSLGISLGLGLLVGIQRERVATPLAGVRTFALITLLGTLSALLAQTLGPWVVVAGLLGVTAAIVTGNVLAPRERADPGITTEIAVLLMYGIGAYLVLGDRSVAVVLTGVVAVLLHVKPAMHGFVQRLGESDMRAMMQFVLISLVILPVLPDRAYGPFAVLNPRQIWWMVVLVVGLSLAGYVALKVAGERVGTIVGGLMGGAISSTATTAVQARRAAGGSGHVRPAALVILLASTVMFVRVLVEVTVVGGAAAARIAPQIAVVLAVSVALCIVVARRDRDHASAPQPTENPAQLRSALVFGALYAVVLLAVAAARAAFGDRGMYAVAALSGLTDMDAITLTAARLAGDGALPPGDAWRAILIAAVSNLVSKSALVATLGGRAAFRPVAVLFAIVSVAAVAAMLLWPG